MEEVPDTKDVVEDMAEAVAAVVVTAIKVTMVEEVVMAVNPVAADMEVAMVVEAVVVIAMGTLMVVVTRNLNKVMEPSMERTT